MHLYVIHNTSSSVTCENRLLPADQSGVKIGMLAMWELDFSINRTYELDFSINRTYKLDFSKCWLSGNKLMYIVPISNRDMIEISG